MSTRTILVPIDFSSASITVLPHAEALAKQSGARLVLVHVEEPPMAWGGGELSSGIPVPDAAGIAASLEEVKPADPSIPVTRRLAMGDPAGEICRIASEERAELIVLGTHGRTGVFRLLMGSVAEAVLRRAPCPVLVYRETAARPATAAASRA